MRYKYVIWDVDGTLLNTSEGVVSAVNDTLKEVNLPILTSSQKEILIGTPKIQDAFKNLYKITSAQALVLANKYREIYKNKFLLKAKEYCGIQELLAVLTRQGIVQAIVTNKREDYAVKICQYFNFQKYCSPILGSDGTPQSEKSQKILKCLKSFNITDKKQVVMIGDTMGDKNAAKQAGIDFIGVNYGFGFKNIEGYANSPSEILDLLKDE